MAQHVVAGAGRDVAEADVPELDAAARGGQGGLGGMLAVADVGHGVEHLVDALGTGTCAGELEQRESEHHNAHQNVHDVADKRVELTGQQRAADDEFSADPEGEHDGNVERDHHDGLHEHHARHRVDRRIAQLVVALFELFLLIVLAHERLHHADGDEVFLHGVVQPVDLFLKKLKELAACLHQKPDGERHHRHDADEDERQLSVDGEADGERGDEHKRRADEDAQTHVHHALNVVDVVREARDERGARKAVDVRKGELLHAVEHRLAQIRAEALTGPGGELHAGGAGEHTAHGEPQHDRADLQNVRKAAVPLNAGVDDAAHQLRQYELAHDLHDNEQRRQDSRFFVAADVLEKLTQHAFLIPSSH